ncbi:MAG TPA: cyanophycinase [Acidobacteriaceae bacterium]|jgi:cyanophycinase|nr:cyanophycinase [Acidobacteriaceae bacterium]
MRFLTAALALALFACCAGAALPASAQTAAPYQYFRVGSKTDVHVHPRAGYALMGGGTDLDEAFRWLCDHADGGDFLVLRASGTDAYNPYVQGLCHLNSVATLIIPSRAAVSDPFVTRTITDAAVIFISGGDQGKYIGNWAGTPVETALRAAVRRGIPMGGTSAGLAVLGQYIYSAQNDKPDDPDLTSAKALADPFYRQVVVAPDLLGIPVLRGIITDTHFDTRHRAGRLLVFMARILASGQTKTIHGIGVDQETAVLVDPDGHARVVGKGEADFFEASGKPQVCQPGEALTFGIIGFDPVHAGWDFDLRHWHKKATGAYLSVRAGQISLHPSL